MLDLWNILLQYNFRSECCDRSCSLLYCHCYTCIRLTLFDILDFCGQSSLNLITKSLICSSISCFLLNYARAVLILDIFLLIVPCCRVSSTVYDHLFTTTLHRNGGESQSQSGKRILSMYIIYLRISFELCPPICPLNCIDSYTDDVENGFLPPRMTAAGFGRFPLLSGSNASMKLQPMHHSTIFSQE